MADLDNSDKTVKAGNNNGSFTGLNLDTIEQTQQSSSSSTSPSPSPAIQTQLQQGTNQWPVDAKSYTILGKVGRGAFATVYKAYHTPPGSGTKKQCAIKVINLELVDTNFTDIRQEVQTMRFSMNENILGCHTSFIHHTNLWLVMQLMDRGSSLHCLQTARILYNPMNQLQPEPEPAGDDQSNSIGNGKSKFPIPSKTIHEINMEQHITYILHETILGLQYIHDNGQIHRDIKAGNILLDSDGNVRIADFGVSGWLINFGSQRDHTRTFVGTPCWMAPEVMEQIHGYDTKADIWSLGITALELAKGIAPYAKYPPMKVLLLTIQEDPPSLDTYEEEDDGFGCESGRGIGGEEEKWSDSFRDMIGMCLQKDPSQRPNCAELLDHEHFRPLRDEAVRKLYKERIKAEICDLIPDVGHEHELRREQDKSRSGTAKDQSNSNIPVSFVSENLENVPSGTTWIFSDGSHVAASGSGEKQNAKASEEDDQDFFDTFERTTQGEDFRHPSMANSVAENKKDQDQATEKKKNEEDDEKDDLNAFMDQFEQETGGENFMSN